MTHWNWPHAQLRQNMLDAAKALADVDFNTVPNYQIMRQIYSELVSDLSMPGSVAADVVAAMSINVSPAAFEDKELMEAMVKGSAFGIKRFWLTLQQDFGPSQAETMIGRLSHQFRIDCDW